MHVFYEKGRDISPQSLIARTFVITTYDIVRRDWDKVAINKDRRKRKSGDPTMPPIGQRGPLFDIRWDRIILDEANRIKTPDSAANRAVCELRGGRRWCLTGTAFNNSASDLAGLARFIDVAPYNDEGWWRSKGPTDEDVVRWRNEHLLMRDKSCLDLPPVQRIVVRVQLSDTEVEFHKNLELQAIANWQGYIRSSSTGNERSRMYQDLLVWLTRLRQSSCDPLVLKGREATLAFSRLSKASARKFVRHCSRCDCPITARKPTPAPVAHSLPLPLARGNGAGSGGGGSGTGGGGGGSNSGNGGAAIGASSGQGANGGSGIARPLPKGRATAPPPATKTKPNAARATRAPTRGDPGSASSPPPAPAIKAKTPLAASAAAAGKDRRGGGGARAIPGGGTGDGGGVGVGFHKLRCGHCVCEPCGRDAPNDCAMCVYHPMVDRIIHATPSVHVAPATPVSVPLQRSTAASRESVPSPRQHAPSAVLPAAPPPLVPAEAKDHADTAETEGASGAAGAMEVDDRDEDVHHHHHQQREQQQRRNQKESPQSRSHIHPHPDPQPRQRDQSRSARHPGHPEAPRRHEADPGNNERPKDGAASDAAVPKDGRRKAWGRGARSGNMTPLRVSSKTRTFVAFIHRTLEEDPLCKFVAFSQWTSYLDLVENALDRAGIACSRMDGDMHGVDQREKEIDRFRAKPEVKVLLISLHAGSMGLNLCCADVVVLLDLWYNPFLEAQAVERVHRIGQRRPVRVVRLICDTAIDRCVRKMQGAKRRLAARYLTGRVFDGDAEGEAGGGKGGGGEGTGGGGVSAAGPIVPTSALSKQDMESVFSELIRARNDYERKETKANKTKKGARSKGDDDENSFSDGEDEGDEHEWVGDAGELDGDDGDGDEEEEGKEEEEEEDEEKENEQEVEEEGVEEGGDGKYERDKGERRGDMGTRKRKKERGGRRPEVPRVADGKRVSDVGQGCWRRRRGRPRGGNRLRRGRSGRPRGQKARASSVGIRRNAGGWSAEEGQSARGTRSGREGGGQNGARDERGGTSEGAGGSSSHGARSAQKG